MSPFSLSAKALTDICSAFCVSRWEQESSSSSWGNPSGAVRFCHQSSNSLSLTTLSSFSSSRQTEGPESNQVPEKPLAGTEVVPGKWLCWTGGSLFPPAHFVNLCVVGSPPRSLVLSLNTEWNSPGGVSSPGCVPSPHAAQPNLLAAGTEG